MLKAAIVLCPVYGTRFPPLGLAIISSIMKAHGIEPRAYDLNIKARIQSENQDTLWHRDKVFSTLEEMDEMPDCIDSALNAGASDICAYAPDFVAFSLYDTNIKCACRLVQILRSKGFSGPFIAGGPAITRRWPSIASIREYFDVCIPGEAEHSLPAFIGSLRKHVENRQPEDIRQYGDISCRDQGAEPCSAAPNLSLDDVPYPDFDDFPLKDYDDPHILPAWIGRGCTMKCSFCGERKLYKSYNHRSFQRAAREIEYLRDRYEVRHFYFHDSLINPWPGFLEKLCGYLKPLQITWEAQVKISHEFDSRLCDIIKNSGCIKLSFGAESGSSRMLKKMNKPATPELTINSARAMYNAGIDFTAYFIAGYPGETMLDTAYSGLLIHQLSRICNYGDLYFYPCGLYAGHPYQPLAGFAGKNTGHKARSNYFNKRCNTGFHLNWSAGLHSPLERALKIRVYRIIHSLTSIGCLPEKANKASELIQLGRKLRMKTMLSKTPTSVLAYSDSMSCFKKAARIAPVWFMPWREIAWTLEICGHHRAAAAAYKKALKANPDDTISATNLTKLSKYEVLPG